MHFPKFLHFGNDHHDLSLFNEKLLLVLLFLSEWKGEWKLHFRLQPVPLLFETLDLSVGSGILFYLLFWPSPGLYLRDDSAAPPRLISTSSWQPSRRSSSVLISRPKCVYPQTHAPFSHNQQSDILKKIFLSVPTCCAKRKIRSHGNYTNCFWKTKMSFMPLLIQKSKVKNFSPAPWLVCKMTKICLTSNPYERHTSFKMLTVYHLLEYLYYSLRWKTKTRDGNSLSV